MSLIFPYRGINNKNFVNNKERLNAESTEKNNKALERIITVMEDQIALCGPDDEHDRIIVYMTADDSKRIVEWLKEREKTPEIITCKNCKNGEMDTASYPQYWCSTHNKYVMQNYFCADGEQR